MSTTLAESPVSRAEALDYCRWLARAGYLFADLGDEKFRVSSRPGTPEQRPPN